MKNLLVLNSIHFALKKEILQSSYRLLLNDDKFRKLAFKREEIEGFTSFRAKSNEAKNL